MNGGLQLHLTKHLLYTSFLGLCTHLAFNILRQDVVNAQTLYETAAAMMTILSILLFDDNDAISGSDGGGKGTVILIASGIAHGDGDGGDGIDRKIRRKISVSTH